MKKNIYKNKKSFLTIFTLGVFCFYFYLAYSTPLTGDDWFWGSSAGLEKLDNWFENYNGRYLGNLTVLLLTRVEWLKVFTIALFSTVLVILVANSSKFKFNYILSIFLFLCIPTSIFSQTYSWVSGFANYITSIVFILIYLTMIKNIFETEIPKYRKWMPVLAIPLGITTQLFVEHITLYAIVMSLFVIIYSFIKFKKFYSFHIVYFISVVIGAMIMFSNGAYTNIVDGEDNYRSVNNSGIDLWLLFKIIYNVYTERMYPMLFSNNMVLNILLSVFCIILIYKNWNKTFKLVIFIRGILLITLITYPFYQPLVLDLFKINVFHNYSNDFTAIFSLLFYMCVLLTIFLYADDRVFKHKIFFYLISAVFLVLPLIFVNPFGPRNFIASYAFFVMALTQIVHYIASKYQFNFSVLNKCLASSALILVFCYAYVFALNDKVDQERMAYIDQSIDAKEKSVTLTKLPFEQFLWMSTPDISGFHYIAFKEYHNIPAQAELKMISYKEWRKVKELIITINE